MGPFEHYREAEQLLQQATHDGVRDPALLIATAQVHATLAGIPTPVTTGLRHEAQQPTRPATFDDYEPKEA